MGEKKNFLITGANANIGSVLVKKLLEGGEARLLLTSRKSDNLGFLPKADNIKHLSGVDLTKKEDLEILKKEADTFFQGPFNVVHCAGYYRGHEPFKETSLEEAHTIFERNFITTYNMAHTVVPIMVEKGGGHFIAFSCNSLKYHYPHMAPFTAAKSAVESLVKSLSNEYAKDGINANAIALATVQTGPEMEMKPCGDHENWMTPEEVSEFIVQMVSDPFKIMTGNAISVFKYSDTFYNNAYFDRIKRKKDK